MKKSLLVVGAMALLTVGGVAATKASASAVSAPNTAGYYMYRVYNPNSGEHFYTQNVQEEQNLVNAGWTYEGVGWIAPKSGSPVYRLYNANAGDHFYTPSAYEKDSLVKSGWKYEGIGWYSGGKVPLYRAYNPNAKAGSHNYTTNSAEQTALTKAGWKGEGTAWYGVGSGFGAAPGQNWVGIVWDSNNVITAQRVYTTKNEAKDWAYDNSSYRGYYGYAQLW